LTAPGRLAAACDLRPRHAPPRGFDVPPSNKTDGLVKPGRQPAGAGLNGPAARKGRGPQSTAAPCRTSRRTRRGPPTSVRVGPHHRCVVSATSATGTTVTTTLTPLTTRQTQFYARPGRGSPRVDDQPGEGGPDMSQVRTNGGIPRGRERGNATILRRTLDRRNTQDVERGRAPGQGSS